MKFTVVIALFVVCAFAAVGLALNGHPAKASKIAEYSVTVDKSHKVNVSYNRETGYIAVGFLNGKNAVGYAGKFENGEKSAVLKQTRTYGKIEAFDTVTATMVSDTSISIVDPSGNVLASSDIMDVEEIGGYNCTTTSGTGPCDNVNTNSDWWRCFRCCVIIGCTAQQVQ